MDKDLSTAFINYFANKYLTDILPAEVIDTLKPTSDELQKHKKIITNWENKISVLHHWDSVLIKPENDNFATSSLKKALFENKQVSLSYEGKENHFLFNPYGMVIRDQQSFIVGSYENNQKPYLLAIRKVKHINLTKNPALTPAPGFDLDEFASKHLNSFDDSSLIEELEIEFPIYMKSYVDSYPLICGSVKTIPLDSEFFKLIANDVPNSKRLQQWLSGFHDNIHIIKPLALRQLINRDLIDNLTNLYNRNFFDRLFRREIHHFFRNPNYCFSILTLDIDHFKNINDTYGHLVGDEALKHVANKLRDDDAIRYGGEEFYVLLPNANADSAYKAAERIRKSIANSDFRAGDNHISLTISIGIAEFPKHLSANLFPKIAEQKTSKPNNKLIQPMIADILERADIALYHAKDNGRNQSVSYGTNLKPTSREHYD